MAYTAAYMDAAGLHLPTYNDILEYYIESAKTIFGQDIYITEDTADYQLLSLMALVAFDANQAVGLSYNQRSPLTAIGAGLDGLVKVNGLSRKVASYSTCTVTLTGTAGAVITNGIITDTSGNRWDLPSYVTIGEGGTVAATATCETIGAITALSGTLTTITTPTSGWTSVTNATAATAGSPVETDAQLRTRQAISTQLPSETIIDGTKSALASVEGVTRFEVYENTTDSTDGNGLISHSIEAVVEGGSNADIAQAIYDNRGAGCGINGTISVSVTSPVYENSISIKFTRTAYTDIYISVELHELSGYTTDMATLVQDALYDYLNSLQIGQSVTYSALMATVMSVNPVLSRPAFTVTTLHFGTSASPSGSTDISIAFDHVAKGDTSKIIVSLA